MGVSSSEMLEFMHLSVREYIGGVDVEIIYAKCRCVKNLYFRPIFQAHSGIITLCTVLTVMVSWRCPPQYSPCIPRALSAAHVMTASKPPSVTYEQSKPQFIAHECNPPELREDRPSESDHSRVE